MVGVWVGLQFKWFIIGKERNNLLLVRNLDYSIAAD